MKNNALRILAVLGLAAVMAAPAAFAQLTVNVPFDFTVSSKTLPAGQYEIAPTSGQHVLRIRHADGRGVALVSPLFSTGRNPKNEAKLVFHRYGNQYFLSQVWGVAPGCMSELKLSKAEKEAATISAKAGTSTVVAYKR